MKNVTLTCSTCSFCFRPVAPSCIHSPLMLFHFLLQRVLFYFQVLHGHVFKVKSPHRDKICNTHLSVSGLLLLTRSFLIPSTFLFIQLLTGQEFLSFVGRMQRAHCFGRRTGILYKLWNLGIVSPAFLN